MEAGVVEPVIGPGVAARKASRRTAPGFFPLLIKPLRTSHRRHGRGVVALWRFNGGRRTDIRPSRPPGTSGVNNGNTAVTTTSTVPTTALRTPTSPATAPHTTAVPKTAALATVAPGTKIVPGPRRRRRAPSREASAPTVTAVAPPSLSSGQVVDVLRSEQRSGASSTSTLVEALRPLQNLGMTAEEALALGMGQFPLLGMANWTDDWTDHRSGPSVHQHQGNDVFSAFDTPVRAVVDGTVRFEVGGLGQGPLRAAAPALATRFRQVPSVAHHSFSSHLHSYSAVVLSSLLTIAARCGGSRPPNLRGQLRAVTRTPAMGRRSG